LSDSLIPHAVAEDDWAGMGTVYLPKCHCDRFTKLKKVWGGRHTGRRFFGCPNQVNFLWLAIVVACCKF